MRNSVVSKNDTSPRIRSRICFNLGFYVQDVEHCVSAPQNFIRLNFYLKNSKKAFHFFRILFLENTADIYLLKVNSRDTRTRCEICSKLTIKTPERRQWRRYDAFIVNSEHVSHLVLVFLLLTLKM